MSETTGTKTYILKAVKKDPISRIYRELEKMDRNILRIFDIAEGKVHATESNRESE